MLVVMLSTLSYVGCRIFNQLEYLKDLSWDRHSALDRAVAPLGSSEVDAAEKVLRRPSWHPPSIPPRNS